MFILIPIRGFAEAAASPRLINSATKLALTRLGLRTKAERHDIFPCNWKTKDNRLFHVQEKYARGLKNHQPRYVCLSMLQRTTRFSRASAQRNVSNAPLSRFSFIFPSYSSSCSRAPFSTFSLRACSTSKLLPATTHDFQPVYRKNFSNIRAARLFSQEH